jgi:hypothetical protein
VGDARRKFADLARRALDNFFESKSLLPFEIASGHNAWWPALSEPLKGTFSFSWPDGPSERSLSRSLSLPSSASSGCCA